MALSQPEPGPDRRRTSFKQEHDDASNLLSAQDSRGDMLWEFMRELPEVFPLLEAMDASARWPSRPADLGQGF